MQWKQYGSGKENKMKKNVVNVLGTEYEIKSNEDIYKTLMESQNTGECDMYAKVISISPQEYIINDSREDVRKSVYNICMRHEILHAFFHEAGVDKYSADETLVDFIAMQFPKMKELFEEVGCDD